MAKKYVYSFGGGKADGKATMRNLLGGKGANLAEMAGQLKLPVPPGFTITTDVCVYYYDNKKRYPKELKEQVENAMIKIEKIMKKSFQDKENPLLVSVRSGARASMPGMMETILNVGLTEKIIPGLAKKFGSERFAYDAYRRLITMYSDVVMEKSAGIEPEEGKGIRTQLDKMLEKIKKDKKVKNDSDLDVETLKKLCKEYKTKIKKMLGKEFPDDAKKQLWGAITAVFQSWNGKRAIAYRRIENIPGEWGTAVNVQSMAFGNTGDNSSTGVAFTRNPGNGENKFYGEYLINAQGEDVVAGIRTPSPINKDSKNEQNKNHKTLQELSPEIYKKLEGFRKKLEKHYKDMQDIEFTVEEGELFMLQCRSGKRNGPAAVKMALDMVKEKLIDQKTAINRVTPEQLDELLHPIIDNKVEKVTKVLGKGLPAGPGGATGQIVFTSDDAVEWKEKGKNLILVRDETNPEDVEGMRAAEAILTARGGMTSHAALVARGWGKCCIVGCGDIEIDYKKRELKVKDTVLKEGDFITLNGTTGSFYQGSLKMIDGSESNEDLHTFLKICDKYRKLKVRTNAETPEDAKKAKYFGAEGIGLFRTEHMFYGNNSEKPLSKLRKMIMSKTKEERKKALNELYPYIKRDMKATLNEMVGYPVTIRLLDPPLHEFVPQKEEGLKELEKDLKITREELKRRIDSLHETNPMMGHRGVRLGITYPEVTEMQVRAILEAAAELIQKKKKVNPEIMIPVVCSKREVEEQKKIVDRVYKEVKEKYKISKINYLCGTMIEIPRAALTANKIAESADFFSFGTNDLTQMSFGFSRDDIGSFLSDYLKDDILPGDPFQSIDEDGVGELIQIGVERGRKTKPNLKIGICGEHGGDPASISFCQKIGMNYVSCSPYRVPVARLAAAQAELANGTKKKVGKKKIIKKK